MLAVFLSVSVSLITILVWFLTQVCRQALREPKSWQIEHSSILPRNQDQAAAGHLHEKASNKMSLAAFLGAVENAGLRPHLARPRLVQVLSVCWVEEGMFVYICIRFSADRKDG